MLVQSPLLPPLPSLRWETEPLRRTYRPLPRETEPPAAKSNIPIAPTVSCIPFKRTSGEHHAEHGPGVKKVKTSNFTTLAAFDEKMVELLAMTEDNDVIHRVLNGEDILITREALDSLKQPCQTEYHGSGSTNEASHERCPASSPHHHSLGQRLIVYPWSAGKNGLH